MNILADYKQDSRTVKTKPGGYEWWYFDGVDGEGVYRFAIIFYEGNPVSTRYIQRIKKRHHSEDAYPVEHPAVSIAIYKDQEPLYFSFTEYEKEVCSFDESEPKIKIGKHEMQGTEKENGILEFNLRIKEELPSGDKIVGEVKLRGKRPPGNLLGIEEPEVSDAHYWNLVLPRAEFEARFRIYARNEESKRISIEGTAYHDHNTGEEPMRNAFKEWYWGRFHFDNGTLIYYLMEENAASRQEAWLISPDNSRILQYFNNITKEDMRMNKYGLRSARRILLSNEEAHVSVQQAHVIDNSPFYQRFDSDSFLNLPKQDVMEVKQGISDYLRPDRIYWRIFWPLIDARIRYKNESPHWIQQSKTLYRWTW